MTDSKYQAVPVACPHLNEEYRNKTGRNGCVEAIVRFVDFGKKDGVGLRSDSIMCPLYDDRGGKEKCKFTKKDCEYRFWKGF
jgi:hypothetical protein